MAFLLSLIEKKNGTHSLMGEKLLSAVNLYALLCLSAGQSVPLGASAFVIQMGYDLINAIPTVLVYNVF